MLILPRKCAPNVPPWYFNAVFYENAAVNLSFFAMQEQCLHKIITTCVDIFPPILRYKENTYTNGRSVKIPRLWDIFYYCKEG